MQPFGGITGRRDDKMHASGSRIGKRVVLSASRSRLWRALSDSEEFGAWFMAAFE